MTMETSVCVIGAGPAGATVTSLLADRGYEVTLLDAGPRFDNRDRRERMERELRPTFGRSDVWDMGGSRDAYSTTGIDYPLNDTRVKGIGGTTLHWMGMCPRLHPEDFEMRDRYAIGADWPIEYDDLETYYSQAERLIGVAGEASGIGGRRSEEYPLPPHGPSYGDSLFADALKSIGLTLHACPIAINSEPYNGRGACEGFGTCNPVCPSGAKYSADVHVDQAERAGATVIDEAPVRRLETNDRGNRIVAASVRTNGRTRQITADRFVLAAGGVESVRLLLLSATDAHPDGLANSSGLVGRYFCDHPSIKIEGELDDATRQHLIGFDTGISESFYGHDVGPEGSMLFIVDNEAGPSPLDLALGRRANVGHLVEAAIGGPLRGDTFGASMAERIRSGYGNHVGLTVQVEPQPRATHRVSLDPHRQDDVGDPVPHIEMHTSEATQATLSRAQAVLFDAMDALGAQNLRPVGSPETPYFNNHHMGGLRMGSDPEHSVIDANLRTHDVENLYVCSSAAFPTPGAVPPTLTIVALAIRLVDQLAATL